MRIKLITFALASISLASCKKETAAMDPNAAKPYPVVSVENKNITGY